MSRRDQREMTHTWLRRAARLGTVALSMALSIPLVSGCRSVGKRCDSCAAPVAAPHQNDPYGSPMPPEFAGGPLLGSGPNAFPAPQVAPLPMMVVGDWNPPGIDGPWPNDEYIRDGGDIAAPTKIGSDWSIHGLDIEDTVGHYDTVEGQTIVEPSNPVFIYAPRFASVRAVHDVIQEQQIEAPGGARMPIQIAGYVDTQIAVPRYQAEQVILETGERQPGELMMRAWASMKSQRLGPNGFDNIFAAYEDLQVIRNGIFELTETARLSQVNLAAITWSGDQSVQVTIDGQKAVEDSTAQKAQQTFTFDEFGAPKLRVIKVASTPVALPGDIIDFTIRFDNVGTKVMGNVAIIDNLSPRLEFVAGSAQASVDAEFYTEENESGSLVLRWEVNNPIKKGDGGLVRFKCRVR